MLELPTRDPCDLCVAAAEEQWKIIDESEHTLTVINPWQFEVGQCCVITRRHVATIGTSIRSPLLCEPGICLRYCSMRTSISFEPSSSSPSTK